jgi:hypothetical protein
MIKIEEKRFMNRLGIDQTYFLVKDGRPIAEYRTYEEARKAKESEEKD